MTTNHYNSEDTRYLNPEEETTELKTNSEIRTNGSKPTTKAKATQADKSALSWKRTAASAGIGVLIGSAIPLFSSMMHKGDVPTQEEAHTEDAVDSEESAILEEQQASPTHNEGLSHPELVDDMVPVATTVTSDMTFGQAFAAARTEVGPGGVFEWHDNLYGTYTAEEWNSMSAAEQAEYVEHFAWNQIDHQNSDIAPQDQQLADNTTVTEEVVDAANDADVADVTDDADDDIVVTHVDQPSDVQTDGDLIATTTEEPTAEGDDSEVVILGVTHDDDSGQNEDGVAVDGNEIVLVDVDGDMKFDVAVEDVNDNGQSDEQDLTQDTSQDDIAVDMLQQPPVDTYIANTSMDSGNEGGYEA